MKKFLLFFTAFFLFFISSDRVFAENFTIENYDVQINVNRDKTFHVKETIDTNFHNNAHGIFRTIPLKYTIKRTDGSQQKVTSTVSNVAATDFYSKETVTENGVTSCKIKLGDANRYVFGPKTYEITYDYKMPKSNLKDNEELYFNIIGKEWQTGIKNINFEITMPQDFNTDLIGFSVGREGYSGYNDGELNYSVDGRKITGTVRPLGLKEGVTVRITLPKDYFETELLDFQQQIVICVIIFLTLISFLIWFIYGKDEPVVPIVTFYPPKDRNSAEVGVEYSENASDKEVVSLVIYLASKGYIQIEDKEYDCFTLTKLKDYDGKNPVEKRLMNALFTGRNVVSQDMLENSADFYKKCQTIQSVLNSKYKVRLFDKNAVTVPRVVSFIACIIGIIASVLYSLNGYSWNFSNMGPEFFFCMLFVIIGGSVFFGTIFNKKNHIFVKIFITFWASGFAGIPLFVIISQCNFTVDVPVLVTGVICLVISIICLQNLPKRNKLGRKLLGEVLGLKKFLEVARKEEIENLVRENPSYCYDLLPYAYVLGVTDKWINKFEGIAMENPTWYIGSVHNNFIGFTTSMNSLVAPSAKNGGITVSTGGSFGGGGGGCSGGGGGGGGGGSW